MLPPNQSGLRNNGNEELVACLSYGTSTFVRYLVPDPFLVGWFTAYQPLSVI